MIKFLVACSVFFQAYLANASIESCKLQVRDYAIRMVAQNPRWVDRAPRMIEALAQGPDHAVLMVNWVGHQPFSISELFSLKERAQRLGVNILEDISFHEPQIGEGAEYFGQLTTLVLEGNKTRISKLLKTISSPGTAVVNFQIINDLQTVPTTDFISLHSRTPGERESTLTRALAESKSNLVLVNDAATHSFFAAVNPASNPEFRPKEPVSVTARVLLGHWDEYVGNVSKGRSVVFLKGDDSEPTVENPGAYIISLDDLSKIQEQRVKDYSTMVELNKKINKTIVSEPAPESKPESKKEAKAERQNDSGSPKFKIVAINTSDFLLKKPKVFYDKNAPAALSLKRPAVQIRKNGEPAYVAFSPEFLKTASMPEILKVYKYVAGIPEDVYSARFVSSFLSRYQKGTLIPKSYKKYSLSELAANGGFERLARSSASQQPIIATQLVSVGNDDEMILVPVAAGWKIPSNRQ